MDKQPRQPEGIPAGGQFANKLHGVSDVVLGFARRAEVLARAGYVPPTVMPSASDPRSSTRAKEWWDRARISAEYGGGFPQMQDLVEGPVQRRHYGNDRIKLRMPAVSTIKACAQKNPGTFDVPVSMSLGGAKPVQGWVRVTPGPGQTWHVETLGGSGPAAAELAEAVTAVLEARRPTRALPEIKDLLARREERMAGAGVKMRQANSSFITGVGYDPATETLATRIGDRLYGHTVSRELFDRVRTSENPGQAFNRLVRGRSQRVAVAECTSCGRTYSQEAGHTCPAPARTAAGPVNSDARREAIQASRLRSMVRLSRPGAAKRRPVPAPASETPGTAAVQADDPALEGLTARQRLELLTGGEF